MARPLCIGVLYHVTSRGNARLSHWHRATPRRTVMNNRAARLLAQVFSAGYGGEEEIRKGLK